MKRTGFRLLREMLSKPSKACSPRPLSSMRVPDLNLQLGMNVCPIKTNLKNFSTEPPYEEEKAVDEPKSSVLVEKMEDLHIMTIGINRPDKRNSVNTETAEHLKMAFNDFEIDDNMYCAVLHGLGGNFCAGYDLEELSELEEDLANKIAEILMDQGPMGPTKMQISKPVIAAVNGFCVAGGLELAIMCDLRVVEDNCKLGFLNRRFGVPLIDGGTVR